VAIEPLIAAEAPSFDAGGKLVAPGFLWKTHIHLDKSNLLSRCTSSDGSLDKAIAEGRPSEESFHGGGRLRPGRADAEAVHPARPRRI